MYAEAAERCDLPSVGRLLRQTGAVVEPEVKREVDRVCAALDDAGRRIAGAELPGGTARAAAGAS
jgi:hypothetical protein